jgi:hypothetical protein
MSGGGSGSSSNGGGSASNGIYATAYGVVGEGHQSSLAVVTGAPTEVITCATCNFTTNATAGQVLYMSNLTATGFGAMAGATLITPVGTTILSVDSNTQIHASANVTANCATNACLLSWGTDESTQVATAWTAALTACVPLILPGLNPENTGPAMILVSTASFIGSGTTCGTTAVGSTRHGPSLVGQGITATYILPTPSFSGPTCNSGISGVACFGGNGDGMDFCCFTIHGGGNSAVGSAFNSKIGFELDASNNSKAHDIDFLAWGSGTSSTTATALGVGWEIIGGEIDTRHMEEDGFGYVGHVIGSGGGLGPVVEYFPVAYDNGGTALEVNNASNPNDYFTVGGNYGSAGAMTACVIGGGNWNSDGDEFGLPNGACCGVNIVGVGSCVTQSGTVTGAGTMKITNGKIYANASAGHAVFTNASTDILHLIETQVVGTGTASTGIIYNQGIIFDDCGNIFKKVGTETYYFSSGGVLFGSCSITGLAPIAANYALTSGWGTSSVGTITGDARHSQFTITTTVTGSASPVLTYTFPTENGLPGFLIAPSCTLIQDGGTFSTLSNPSHVITATTDTITFTGTPTASQSYTFVEDCK